MKKKKHKFKKFKSFDEFIGKTESYPPPEYVIQPADGDTGYELIKAELKDIKKEYGIKTDI